MTVRPIVGLVAATHTPFDEAGALDLAVVERQAEHLRRQGVRIAFVGGTTGEASSLTVEERLALAARWRDVTRDTDLDVIVHVGANSLEDARMLAAHAQQLGVRAVGAVAPSYFKPASIEALVGCMARIAAAAPDLPFYYYEVPSLSGIALSPSQFLAQAAERIPTLAGVKFTSSNLLEYQLCRAASGGRFDVPFGFDEMLLAALALGATGAVGSSYNFAAPVYHRLIATFAAGDLEGARAEQMRSVRLVQALAARGYMSAAKATMQMVGVPVGPPRLPHVALGPEETRELQRELEWLGFFEWI